MQYDMERFDQPLVDVTQPKAHVWTDIGEAEVEHSIFGKARVRVHRRKDEIRGTVRWGAFTLALVIGAIWLAHDYSRQPEIVYVPSPAPIEVASPEVAAPPPVVPKPVPRVIPVAPARVAPLAQATSAPIAARPLVRTPAAVSGASAPVASRTPVVTRSPASAPVAATVIVKPAVPVVAEQAAHAASAVPPAGN